MSMMRKWLSIWLLKWDREVKCKLKPRLAKNQNQVQDKLVFAQLKTLTNQIL